MSGDQLDVFVGRVTIASTVDGRSVGETIIIDVDGIPALIRLHDALANALELFQVAESRRPLLRARAALLGKPSLDEADRRQVAELDLQLAKLPRGDTREDREAWQIVHRFADTLKSDHGADGEVER